MTIPHSITDAGLVFIARGRPYQVAKDHAAFGPVLKVLRDQTGFASEVERFDLGAVEDVLISFVDFAGEIQRLSGGRLTYVDDRLTIDGVPLHDQEPWTAALATEQSRLRILLVREGDMIVVAGDEDLPDGTYPVSGIDLTDVDRTLYVENEDSCFYGYVPNGSVKDWIPHSAAHMAEDAA